MTATQHNQDQLPVYTPQVVSTYRAMQNAPDLVHVGAQLVGAGLSTLAAQGLADRLQRQSLSMAMETTVQVLDEVRKVIAAELAELAIAVRQLDTYTPSMTASIMQGLNGRQKQLIDRDQVLVAIANVAARVARP